MLVLTYTCKLHSTLIRPECIFLSDEINTLAQVLSVLLVYLWGIFCIMCWFTKLGPGEIYTQWISGATAL